MPRVPNHPRYPIQRADGTFSVITQGATPEDVRVIATGMTLDDAKAVCALPSLINALAFAADVLRQVPADSGLDWYAEFAADRAAAAVSFLNS